MSLLLLHLGNLMGIDLLGVARTVCHGGLLLVLRRVLSDLLLLLVRLVAHHHTRLGLRSVLSVR